jgi:hypothetical protein
MDVHDLGRRDDHHGARVYLYVPIGDTGLLLGIPLNASILMKFAPMGPYMTEHSRHRPGLLLQCRPGDRLGFHDRDRLCDGGNAAWHSDSAVLDFGSRADDSSAAAFATTPAIAAPNAVPIERTEDKAEAVLPYSSEPTLSIARATRCTL